MLYKMPDGNYTNCPDDYGAAWQAIGIKLEQIFEGYTFSSCDPKIKLEKRVIDEETNTYEVIDSFEISVEAAIPLIKKINKMMKGKEE